MTVLLAWCTAALAAPVEDEPVEPVEPVDDETEAPEEEEDEEAVPGRVELSVEDDLGSALEDFAEEGERVALEGGPGLEDWEALRGGFLRGRWAVRPLMSVAHLPGSDGGSAVRLGGALAHQWWTLGERDLQLGGETRLEVTAPVGGAVGRRVALDTDLGPWLGPVGLRVGPGLRWDRTDWRSAGVLENGLGIGPRVGLTGMIGKLRPTVGLQADWFVTGDRAAADPSAATFPVLGDETAWTAGAAWIGKPIVWSVQGSWRETALGPVIDVGLGLHLRPF